MQSERPKRLITLLDDGELPDQHVDPKLDPAVFPNAAAKAKRQLGTVTRPSLRAVIIRWGRWIIAYFILYVLSEFFSPAGLLSIIWGAAAFLTMPLMVGRYLMGVYESWEAKSDPYALNSIGQALALSVIYLVLMAAWTVIVFWGVIIMIFKGGGGIGE